jgi:hypothetical protein
MPQQWDPKLVLHLDGDDLCVGWDYPLGRKLTHPLGYMKAAGFNATLAQMAQQEPDADLLRRSLIRLAKYGLCSQDQYQVADMVHQWQRAILAAHLPTQPQFRPATPPQPVEVIVRPDSPQDPIRIGSATQGGLRGAQHDAPSPLERHLDMEMQQHHAPEAVPLPSSAIGNLCIAFSEFASFPKSVFCCCF